MKAYLGANAIKNNETNINVDDLDVGNRYTNETEDHNGEELPDEDFYENTSL